MILQELAKLYDRLAEDPAYGLAKPGYSRQKITFEVVLRPDGTLHAIHDLRVVDGKKKQPAILSVPGQAKPSGQGLNPCFMWDNSGYMLGYKSEDEKPERTAEAFNKFREKHAALTEIIDVPEFRAVTKFLNNWNPADIDATTKAILDDAAATGFGVFRIQGAEKAVHEHPAIRVDWDGTQTDGENGEKGLCLISGQSEIIATLHEPAIKGVAGAQSSGAKLVSYNCAAFTSYGKEQGANAPVSQSATFRYCNALNTLIESAGHRMRLGDSTVVFWTEKASPVEEIFAHIFDEKPADKADAQDAKRLKKLKEFWSLISQGKTSGEDWNRFEANPDTPFHILGISPNASRLAIRFYMTGTLGEFAEKISRHVEDMSMIRSYDSDREHPPLWLLLAQTARDSDGIPPLLGGALLRAVLTGSPYPAAMAQLIVNRIRADRKIDHLRAAFLKAFLSRKPNPDYPLPIPMSLDITRTDSAYLLGRLFAVLEKTQKDALGDKLNATIRDRYYSSASATPRAVFPVILRTYQHHLAKMEKGSKSREILTQEIMDKLTDFPAHLNLAAQSLFAIGYYHQTKDFYPKKDPVA